MYEVASLSQFCLRVAAPSPRQRKNGERELPLFVFQMSGRGKGVRLHVVNHSFKGPLNKKCTLGAQSARDVSNAVSGFCQVFIYSDPREMFFSRLRPTAEDVSAFGRNRKFPPRARKSSGTQGITNALREEIVNNHRCQCDWPPVSLSWSPYTLQPHKASGPVSLCP